MDKLYLYLPHKRIAKKYDEDIVDFVTNLQFNYPYEWIDVETAKEILAELEEECVLPLELTAEAYMEIWNDIVSRWEDKNLMRH